MEKVEIRSEIFNLQPSRELLKYYREKISQFEKDNEEIIKLFYDYKLLVDNSAIQEERNQLIRDLDELKSALSDLNIYIHAERQQVAKLHLENEILKTDQQLRDKKIEILLKLCGLSKEQLQVYYIRCSKKPIPNFTIKNRPFTLEELPVDPYIEDTILEKKIKIIHDHFESAKNSWDQEKFCILEDRKIRQAETEAQTLQYEAHIKLLSSKLEEAQRVAYEATKKATEAKSNAQRLQSKWLAEKDKLLLDLGHLQNSFYNKNDSKDCQLLRNLESEIYTRQYDSCEVRNLRRDLSSLKKELIEVENLKSLYEGRCRKVEQEFCHMREQKEAENSLMKVNLTKMKETKELYKKQRDKLDGRLKVQAEGFVNELKLVKSDLRKVIHQFFKLTNFYSQKDDLPDLATIKDIKLATSLARSVHNSIFNTKRKMICLETNYCEENS